MSFRRFLKKMEEQNEVLHVSDNISPKFEVASAIQEFSHGPVLLFENVKGYRTKVVANICGTRSRICSALETRPSDLYMRLSDAQRAPMSPKIVEDAPVMEIQKKPDLCEIPVLLHFERDAGPYITAAAVSARSSDGKIENVSVHRLLVLDKNHLAIRLVPRHLFKLWNMAKKEKRDLEIAISIGLHPAILLAAASSPPFGVSEYAVANRLLGGSLRLVRCMEVEAYVPAEAELVIEGRVSFEKEVREGPFVDITGTYDVQRMQPIVEVVNIMHRKDYVYQALLPGGPEHRLLMGLPREAAVYEAVSKAVPKVKAVNLSAGGCGWLHAVISIEKQTEGDGKTALLAAFAAHPSLKHAIVVDSDIDVFNPIEVEWALALRFQACEDLIIIPNARGSTLDPSADQEQGLTSKMGIDATRPLNVSKENFEKARIPVTKRAAEIIDELKRIRYRQ
ncbi:TPA: UbiD family decarboxylase [Candidatus Bathyarchaeota archaeon]|nr:UbiD family decarboxylase [Candidatus Bathyarchaeota archaeon]